MAVSDFIALSTRSDPLDRRNRRRHRRKALSHALDPHRQDLDGRRTGRLGRRQGARAHPHHALRLWRLRGHPRLPHCRGGWPCFVCATTSSGCSLSAKVFMIDIPYSLDDIIDATRDVVRVNGLDDGCYIRPLVYLGYGEMGLNPIPCPVNVSIAAWPWGTYLGDEGIANGVSVKISSWRRHDPNAVPTAAKGTGMYVNSSLAKVEALKAGYDEAILLAPDGNVSECTGENIFIVRRGSTDHPTGLRLGGPRGHHPAVGRDDRTRPRVRGLLRADHPHRPLHRRRGVPDRYRRRDGARSGPSMIVRWATVRPGRSPRRSNRRSSPHSTVKWTSTRTGWTMSTDGPSLNDDSFKGGRAAARPGPFAQSAARPPSCADTRSARPCRRTGDKGAARRQAGGTTSIFPPSPPRSTSSTPRSGTAPSKKVSP